MGYKYFFVFMLLFCSFACTITDKENKDPVKETVLEEMQVSDKWTNQQKIDFLKEKKLKYESKAINAENQAQRLQFKQGDLQDAKRLWREAEINRQISNELQKKIDELEKSGQK